MRFCCQSFAHAPRRQVPAPALRRGVSRCLPRGADSPPAAFARTLRKKTEIREQRTKSGTPSQPILCSEFSEGANYSSHVRRVLEKANGSDARCSGRKAI